MRQARLLDLILPHSRAELSPIWLTTLLLHTITPTRELISQQ